MFAAYFPPLPVSRAWIPNLHSITVFKHFRIYSAFAYENADPEGLLIVTKWAWKNISAVHRLVCGASIVQMHKFQGEKVVWLGFNDRKFVIKISWKNAAAVHDVPQDLNFADNAALWCNEILNDDVSPSKFAELVVVFVVLFYLWLGRKVARQKKNTWTLRFSAIKLEANLIGTYESQCIKAFPTPQNKSRGAWQVGLGIIYLWIQ